MNIEHDFDAIEYYIIKTLLSSELYCKAYFSKLENSIFSPKVLDVIKSIRAFFNKYDRPPSVKILEDKVLSVLCKKNETRYKKAVNVLNEAMALDVDIGENYDWICDETKKFIKTKRIINAVVQVTDLIEDHKHDEIVSIMEDAFQVSFDESLGMEYFSSLEDRLAKADIKEEIISTGYKTLDTFLGGGYRRKSLYIYAGPSNSGKSLVINDAAMNLSLCGYNVIYLTLELSEKYIQERSDANFSNVEMDEININPKIALEKGILKRNQLNAENKKYGDLIYKEYAPNAISANGISALLKNLEVNRGFKPDFIIIDYLKLIRPDGKIFADNTYGKLTTVAEQIRSLSFEFNACVITASQTGRQSYNQTVVDMEDISDSIGIVQTADAVITLARNDDEDEKQMIMKIAKSRFSDVGKTFMLKLDTKHMRLIDEFSNQNNDENNDENKEETNKENMNDEIGEYEHADIFE